jgi:hypothetical protein
VAGLLVYSPALTGVFISDDLHYVRDNPYVRTLNLDNLIAIWDPTSVVTVLVENYAPVHLLLHALEYQVFGTEVLGYHVVNVLLHALTALMLVEVYRRSGIGAGAAVLGAAVFLLHPANVESVAWISQLKSSSALVLSLAALLSHPKRPALSVILFAFALFAKPFAAFSLVVVALFGWVRRTPSRGEGEGEGAESAEDFRWPWLLAWIATVGLFAVIETFAFSHSAGQVPALYADLGTRFLTMFAIALRYLWMALSGLGLSAFHEPPPVETVLDPWFLTSVVVLGLLAWRLVFCVRERREETVYWAWALVSFAPLSGVVPLPYPMADRYLYFVLPGLIGASLLAANDTLSALAGRLGGGALRTGQLRNVALALVGLLLVHFAVASHGRASVFRSAEMLMADAELNYPNGAAANTRKASRAARMGDFPTAVRHLRLAHERGYNRLDHLLQDPNYGPMQEYPEFVELKHAMADDWIGRLGHKQSPSQIEARAIAQAYIVKDDLPAALRVIEAATLVPGPMTDELRGDADMLRREIDRRARLRRPRGS